MRGLGRVRRILDDCRRRAYLEISGAERKVMRLHSGVIVIAFCGVLLLSRVPWGVQPLFAENRAGKETFEKRCTGCHSLDHEKTGPHLRGVYGREAASVSSFQYSESLRKSGVRWDSGSLDKWLTDPDGFVPDNDMAFRVANKEERAAIIEYLKEVSPQR
jgi:cytochrome c